jgi:DNA-binding NarL/FixJ family response regulator
MTSIRVVIADDNAIVREGVRRLLELEDGIDVVAVCSDGERTRRAVGEHRPDVLLTDIRMPPSGGDEGIRLAAELRETDPDVGVVVLSNYAEQRYALRLFDGGTDRRGYLLKDHVSDPGQLLEALRSVAG